MKTSKLKRKVAKKAAPKKQKPGSKSAKKSDVKFPSKKELREEFGYCEICGRALEDVDYDTPLYCNECIERMESMDIDPESYKEYLAPAKKEQK